MNHRWMIAAVLLMGCGEVAQSTPDAGKDAAPDVQPDHRVFCSGVRGPIDASAPQPPTIFECFGDNECRFGPSGHFICCKPDSGIACF